MSYASARIGRLTALGDVASANRNITPELQALRRSIERDRYGLMAYVLLVRDHCTPSDCAAFRSLTDRNQIVANMDERVYDGLITRYAPSWNAPAPATAAIAGPLAGFPATMATGRPTNAEFPSAASTPPVSIMNPEPSGAGCRGACPCSGGEHASAVTEARGFAGIGGGQETAAQTAAETAHRGCAGSDRAGRGACARGIQRLILPNAVAGR